MQTFLLTAKTSSQCLICYLLNQRDWCFMVSCRLVNYKKARGVKSFELKHAANWSQLVPCTPKSQFSDKVPLGDECCVQTERGLCGLHVSQSPHSICMHTSTPVCACCLFISLCFEDTCLCILYPTWYPLAARFVPQLKLVKDMFMTAVKCWASGLGLTRVVLGLLLGHSFAASTVSHAMASVPPGLPGAASPEARGSRSKPKATSLSSKQRASVTQHCLDRVVQSLQSLPSLQLLLFLPHTLPPSFFLALKHKHTHSLTHFFGPSLLGALTS